MKKIKFKEKFVKYASLILAIMMIFSMLSALASCGGLRDSTLNYIKVVSGGKELEMRVVLTEGGFEEVGLFAIDPWQSISNIVDMTPLAVGKVKNGEAKVRFEIEGKEAELFTKGFVLGRDTGKGYTAVSGVYYVTNPGDIHKNKKPESSLVPGNIKGAIGNTAQLMDVGAKSTVVTVDLGKLIAPCGGVGSIALVFNGYSCYVDRNEVEALDRLIKGYTDAGIYVFLEIVQTRPYSELPAEIKNIAFPSASGAYGYALNMTTYDGATRICGAFDFLSKRYAAGGEYGRAEAFIIGRNVNNYVKNYVGASDAEKTVRNYVSAVRAAYNILMTYNPGGRVYISIDNNWNVSNYNAKEFLSAVAGCSDEGGDFYWQVSVEANASDASLSSIWTDGMTSSQPDFISPVNIEVLSSLLSSGQYTYNGMKRNLLLNRFAIGGINEEARAASYVYAYYKCLEAGNIDGLIYAKIVDDSTLTNGLYTAGGGSNPSERKEIAKVFDLIDSSNAGEIHSAGVLIGSAWDQLYNANKKNAERRQLLSTGESEEHSGKSIKTHADFQGGDMFGFTPAASSEYVELRYSSVWDRAVLCAKLNDATCSAPAGIITKELSLDELKGAGYIGLTAMVSTVSSKTADITVRLSGYTKKGMEKVLVCESRAEANSWFEFYYDVKEFLKDIDGDNITMAVFASASENGGEADELWISQITSEGPMKKEIPGWLITVVICLAVGGGIAAFVVWFNKNYMFVKE